MWTLMDSPVGELRIVEQGGAITAIEFSPFREASGRPLGDRDDAHPVLAETRRQLTAYFDHDLKEFALPLAPQGTTWQKSGLGPAAQDRLWRDRVVRTDRSAPRQEQRRLARGRHGQRQQPDPDRDPLPPGDRCRWQPHGLCRRITPQADPPGARAGRPLLTPTRLVLTWDTSTRLVLTSGTSTRLVLTCGYVDPARVDVSGTSTRLVLTFGYVDPARLNPLGGRLILRQRSSRVDRLSGEVKPGRPAQR